MEVQLACSKLTIVIISSSVRKRVVDVIVISAADAVRCEV